MQNGFDFVIFGCVSEVPAVRSLALYRLVTEVRQHGYTAHAVDQLSAIATIATPEERERILAKVLGPETLVVGLSTSMLWGVKKQQFWGMPMRKMQAFVAEIRRWAPNALIVVGGPQIEEREPHQNYAGMGDYWVIGQGEGPLLAILDHRKNGAALQWVERGRFKMITEAMYPFTEFASADIKWQRSDFLLPAEVVPMEVARGCVFKCAFCAYALTGKKFGDFTRSAETIRAELIRNYEQFGATRYLISDDTINDSLEKVQMLHGVATSLPFQLEWVSFARLDLIWRFPEMAQLLLESGMRGVMFGIETLNDEAGKRVGKGLGRERIFETLKHCRAVWGDQVHITGLFIVGLPAETRESLEATIQWMESDDCPLDHGNFSPLEINIRRQKTKMDKDPGAYGFEFDASHRKWTAEVWDHDVASEVTTAYRNREKASRTTYRQRKDSRRIFIHSNAGVPIAEQLAEVSPQSKETKQMKRRIKRGGDAYARAYIENLLGWDPASDT